MRGKNPEGQRVRMGDSNIHEKMSGLFLCCCCFCFRGMRDVCFFYFFLNRKGRKTESLTPFSFFLPSFFTAYMADAWKIR